MTNELLTKENLTTFATWGAIVLTAVFTYFGIQIDQGALVAGLSMLVTLIIAIYSSKHPNTLDALGNGTDDGTTITMDANDIADTIAEAIERYNANNTIEVEHDEVVDEDGC